MFLIPDGSQKVVENYFSFSVTGLRQRLYSIAKNGGYNVLAIGQHLDDVVENFLLAIFHTGRLRAIKAHYYIRYVQVKIMQLCKYLRRI